MQPKYSVNMIQHFCDWAAGHPRKDLISYRKFCEVKGQTWFPHTVTSVYLALTTPGQTLMVEMGFWALCAPTLEDKKVIKLKCVEVGEEKVTLNGKKQKVEKADFWSCEKGYPTVRLYPIIRQGLSEE